ncbi:DgyrCDS7832 [Dimorphilus gyrociliatus]|uniref:T-complex protein 1 subunit theta n=1 Tax=Dimorphilus gyrociliatus TaxID=2664684 RepID=A0A7I8VUI4_9ANNE|nr:DgyrCDS7832 [Dimorphilus gyrociliatus]
MAMHVPKAPGFSQMLKDGARHYNGLEEAVYRNIDACKELAQTTRSAFGPNGQNKMVINHIEKLFVTNDAATILRELEVQHPAAKMLVLASQQQEQECGDGTNFILIFAGALLEGAEELLRMGLAVTEVIRGFDLGLKKAHELLPSLVCGKVEDLHNKAEVLKAVRSALMSKQYGNEDFLAGLITDASLSIIYEKQRFNVDNVRVCKIVGGGLYSSKVVRGMVFKRGVEGSITKAEKCRVVVYSCPLDIMQTETKGTVLIKTAKELLNFSAGEENVVEAQIKAIAATGVKVVVTGGKVGDLALHYANKYGLLVVRLLSKFDVRRLCRALGATPLPRIGAPSAEECGHCDIVRVDEIGDTPVVVFEQEKEESAVSTILLRGATDNILDDLERAVDDGVNTIKALTKDNQLVAGAGATEIELARQMAEYADTCSGLEQYALHKFASALEIVPRALADNSGVKSTEVISKMYAEHQAGEKYAGFDIESNQASTCNVVEKGIMDLFITKYWGIKFATSACNTILNVDQIIMAKQAGGPKPPPEKKDWDED